MLPPIGYPLVTKTGKGSSNQDTQRKLLVAQEPEFLKEVKKGNQSLTVSNKNIERSLTLSPSTSSTSGAF